MAVKHRQLACQVGVFIEHPLENSMASLSFIFGSWICFANGLGGFNCHLVDSRKPEASTSTRSSDLNKFINNLDELLLLDLPRKIERISVFNMTSTRAASRLLGSDSNRSEEATQSKSLSDLE
jgi:hypothetical protein